MSARTEHGWQTQRAAAVVAATSFGVPVASQLGCSVDAARNDQGHADRFGAVALACQTEHGGGRRPEDVDVRVVGAGR